MGVLEMYVNTNWHLKSQFLSSSVFSSGSSDPDLGEWADSHLS